MGRVRSDVFRVRVVRVVSSMVLNLRLTARLPEAQQQQQGSLCVFTRAVGRDLLHRPRAPPAVRQWPSSSTARDHNGAARFDGCCLR